MINKVRLGDVCILEKASKLNANEGEDFGDFPFFTSGAKIKRTNIAQYDGDFMIMGNGGKATIFHYVGKCSCTSHCIVISAKITCNIRYIYWFLRSNMQIVEEGFKGSGLKNISKEYIKNIEIPLPTIEVQKEIVSILDQSSKLVEKKKEQIDLMNKMVKDLFVDMFGDPMINDKGFVKVRLSELCINITDGTHNPPEFVKEGIPFLFVTNLTNDNIDFETKYYISNETYDKMVSKLNILKGDILLSVVGSYGRSAIVETDDKFYFQRHIGFIKPNREKVISGYLNSFFQSYYGQFQFDNVAKGVAQKTINLSELRNILIIVPPIELQNEFAEKVAKIEKEKEKMKKSLAKYEILHESLMQRSFDY